MLLDLAKCRFLINKKKSTQTHNITNLWIVLQFTSRVYVLFTTSIYDFGLKVLQFKLSIIRLIAYVMTFLHAYVLLN